MSVWLVPIASFFVMWWIVLFAMLPWALGQEEEGEERRLGTSEGAPHRPRLLRAALLTTVISIVLMASFYFVTDYVGYSFDDLPRIVPDFNDTSGR